MDVITSLNAMQTYVAYYNACSIVVFVYLLFFLWWNFLLWAVFFFCIYRVCIY